MFHITFKGVVVFLTEEQQCYTSLCHWVTLGSGFLALFVFLINRGDTFKSKAN